MGIAKLAQFVTRNECILCKKFIGPVCENCLNKVFIPRSPSCFACNKLTQNGKTCPTCRARYYVSGVIAPFRHSDVRELIHVYKYEHDRSLANFFATQLQSSLTNHKFDVLTFMPTTGRRQRMRGFNQAELLCREISRGLYIKPQQTLIRTRHKPQVGASKEQRVSSVEGNFYPISHKIRHKKILLVDDVVTTGATINEAARTLKEAGALSVWVLVIARA